ncbi:MAG: protein TolR [Gemmatimonadetes bacterium]|nr:protein TolR [Gemmatimonadota bacterium]
MSEAGELKGHEYDTPAVNSDINVTPLVDVMLVLLIIFMVVTPALLQGFTAVLPVGDNLQERPEEESRVVVGIDVDGNLYFNKRAVPGNDEKKLVEVMTQAFADRPEDKVLYLKADAGIEYQKVLEIMDMGRDSGARVLAAVSEATPKPKGEK